MNLFSLFLAGLAGALAATILVQATARRKLAENRADTAMELATLRQEKRGLRDEVERQKQALDATRDLLDKADQRLRDAFQSLAAEALHSNRAAFLDLARTSFEGFQKDAAQQLEARHTAIDS